MPFLSSLSLQLMPRVATLRPFPGHPSCDLASEFLLSMASFPRWPGQRASKDKGYTQISEERNGQHLGLSLCGSPDSDKSQDAHWP